MKILMGLILVSSFNGFAQTKSNDWEERPSAKYFHPEKNDKFIESSAMLLHPKFILNRQSNISECSFNYEETEISCPNGKIYTISGKTNSAIEIKEFLEKNDKRDLPKNKKVIQE